MFLLNDRDLLSLRNKRKKTQQKKTQLENSSPGWTSWTVKLRISGPDHPGALHSTCSSSSMSSLCWGTPNWRWQHYRPGVTRADDQVHRPSGQGPFRTDPGAVGWRSWGLLLAGVQPSRGPPGPVPHPALPLRVLGPSRGQDSDFVLLECREVPAEPVLPPALPSGVSTAPSLHSRPRGEGTRYQKLTQKEKFWKLLRPIAGTRVRRLTNAGISSFLSLLEKTSANVNMYTPLNPVCTDMHQLTWIPVRYMIKYLTGAGKGRLSSKYFCFCKGY